MLKRANEVLREVYARRPGQWGRVLEAGGGSHAHFVIPDGASLIALDISHGQLLRNQATTLRVQADVGRIPLAAGSIDVVVCFNVIEHLDDPRPALDEMRRCLASGGVLVLGFPNRGSLKGLVTRATPVEVHRAWYRRVVGKRDRGEGHHDAFPTVFHPSVSVSRMRAWLADNGFEASLFALYDGVAAYGIIGGGWKRYVFGAGYYAATELGRLASLGRWQAAASDVLIVAVLAEPAQSSDSACDALATPAPAGR
jgi:SAM-dependent methyltransferase